MNAAEHPFQFYTAAYLTRIGNQKASNLAELRREGGIERIALRGLSDMEAVRLMETLAGHDLEGTELELAHSVHAEADGSPFFMGELLRHFIETGELIHERDRWTYQGDLAVGIPELDPHGSRLAQEERRATAGGSHPA